MNKNLKRMRIKILNRGACWFVFMTIIHTFCTEISPKEFNSTTPPANGEWSLRFFGANGGSDGWPSLPSPVFNGVSRANFTWGDCLEDIPCFQYFDIQTIHAHLSASKHASNWNDYRQYIVALTESDEYKLFPGANTTINKATLTIKDFKEFLRLHYKNIDPEDPKLIGVKINADDSIHYTFDSSGRPVVDDSLWIGPDYRGGTTLLTPAKYNAARYNDGWAGRVHYNLANPITRHFLELQVRKFAQYTQNNMIGLDNVLLHMGTQYSYLRDNDTGDMNQRLLDKAQFYADDYSIILSNLAASGFRIVSNSLRDKGENYDLKFQNTLISKSGIDGVLMEDQFYSCNSSCSGNNFVRTSGDYTFDYIALARNLAAHRKKLFLSVGHPKMNEQENARQLFLWAHLLSPGNVFLSISVDANYMLPQINYEFYNEDLGSPISEWPLSEGARYWKEFEHGRIEFLTSPPLSIKFIPNGK